MANRTKLVPAEEIKAGKYGQLVLDMKKRWWRIWVLVWPLIKSDKI